MLKKLTVLFVIVLLAGIVAPGVQAEDKPVQLSLLAPVQLFPQETSISGIRLALLYGDNTRVSGIDFGLVLRNTSGLSQGVQMGFVGLNDGDFVGWQDNFVSRTRGSLNGLQMGLVNHAGYVSGVQFGFVNYAGSMHGLQIGLVNIIKQGGQFPVFPIVNWSF